MKNVCMTKSAEQHLSLLSSYIYIWIDQNTDIALLSNGFLLYTLNKNTLKTLINFLPGETQSIIIEGQKSLVIYSTFKDISNRSLMPFTLYLSNYG